MSNGNNYTTVSVREKMLCNMNNFAATIKKKAICAEHSCLKSWI